MVHRLLVMSPAARSVGSHLLGLVPQGSILGPLLFSIYVNHLPGIMNHSQIALFADDIAMYFSNADAVLVQAHINSDLALLSRWAAGNGFRINVFKCQELCFI